jgi:glucose/arabinose dehydrogenase
LISPSSTPIAQGATSTATERQQLERPAEFGRLTGVAVWTDGSLLLAEDESGVMYRISYRTN